jgi:hypothetical protein
MFSYSALIIRSATSIGIIIIDTVIIIIIREIMLTIIIMIIINIIIITICRGWMLRLHFQMRASRLYSPCLDTPDRFGLAVLIFATNWAVLNRWDPRFVCYLAP